MASVNLELSNNFGDVIIFISSLVRNLTLSRVLFAFNCYKTNKNDVDYLINHKVTYFIINYFII